MVYFVDEELSDDEMLSLDASIAGYDEECRAWRSMEEDLEELRCTGVFR